MIPSATITKRMSAKGNIYYKLNVFDGSRYVFPSPEEAIGHARKMKGDQVKIRVKE
jgi:hypothetical protein